jgi:plastocyanin
VTINDNDNAAEQMTVTVTQDVTANGSFTTLAGFTNNGGGVYTFTGTRAQATTALRGLVFTPTNHQVVPGQTVTTGFTIQVNDGLTATDTTTTVIATAINNPPTITGTIAGQQVNDNATIAPFTTTVINDPDNAAEQMTVTVTQSNVLNGSFTTLAGFTSLVPGVYTFTGTRAQATAALNGLVFTPTAHQVSVGSTVTTTFTVVVNDGLVATNSNTSVVAKAINDAPVLDPTVVATLTGITEDNANYRRRLQSAARHRTDGGLHHRGIRHWHDSIFHQRRRNMDCRGDAFRFIRYFVAVYRSTAVCARSKERRHRHLHLSSMGPDERDGRSKRQYRRQRRIVGL